MTKVSDILYENGNYWVCASLKGGYEVYRIGITHSVRCSQIGYKGEEGLKMAKIECDKRANLHLIIDMDKQKKGV